MENRNKEILSKLQDSNEGRLIQTVKEIRASGNIGLLLPLAELALTTQFKNLQQEIFSLMADLKDKNAVGQLVAIISDARFESIRLKVLTACWESGLDFSKELLVFIDLFNKADLYLSIELITLIENNPGEYSMADLEKAVEKLKLNIPDESPDKKSLRLDLAGFLETKKRAG